MISSSTISARPGACFRPWTRGHADDTDDEDDRVDSGIRKQTTDHEERRGERKCAEADVLFQILEETQTFTGGVADDLTAIVRGALAANELFPLEAVEKSSNARTLFDHPIGDFREWVGPQVRRPGGCG